MFNNKVILITGGSSGIGKVTALKFAEQGAKIVFTYKENKTGAEEVVGLIEQMGGVAHAIQADLTQEGPAFDTVQKTLGYFGYIDIVVNNAGRYIEGDGWSGTAEIFERSLAQNLFSVMNISKYVIPKFLEQKSGVIVNVASRYALDGEPEALAYSAAKAGVVNITQAYAKKLSPYGRANCVSPGAVKAGYWLTASQEEINEQPPLIDPEVIADKILYLASEEAKEINGQNFLVVE